MWQGTRVLASALAVVVLVAASAWSQPFDGASPKIPQLPKNPVAGAPPFGEKRPLRLEVFRGAGDGGRVTLRVRGGGAKPRELRRRSVVVFRPEGGAPVVLRDVRWRGRRIEVRLPEALRGRPGTFYLAPADAPDQALSDLARFRPVGGGPGPIARPGLPAPGLPGPGRPEEPPVPFPPPPGAGAPGLPIPGPVPLPGGGGELAMRLDRVVHRAGRRVYPLVGEYRPYSAASLRQCLPLDPEGDTTVALEGRGFGSAADGRTVALVSRSGGERFELPVERWSDREILVRVTWPVQNALFHRGVAAPSRFAIVGRDGRVLRAREVEFCRRSFFLTVTYVFENCANREVRRIARPGGLTEAFEAGSEVRPTSGGVVVHQRYRIVEGTPFRLTAPRVPEGVCPYGRWLRRELTVGPATHARPSLVAEFRHRTEPVEFAMPLDLIQVVLDAQLRLAVRIHNWAGTRLLPAENASWIRTGDGTTVRFTVPRFEAELGGVLDPAVPDLISYVNDINSERVSLRLAPAGRNIGVTIEARFESEGVEVKNYANTGNQATGDDLYPDAQLDNGKVTIEGLAVGWDRDRSQPGVVGRPRVTVDVDFSLRGVLGALEALPPLMDRLEREIERRVAREVERALSSPVVQDRLDRLVLGQIEQAIRASSQPPVERYLDAYVERREYGPTLVIRYVPRG